MCTFARSAQAFLQRVDTGAEERHEPGALCVGLGLGFEQLGLGAAQGGLHGWVEGRRYGEKNRGKERCEMEEREREGMGEKERYITEA